LTSQHHLSLRRDYDEPLNRNNKWLIDRIGGMQHKSAQDVADFFCISKSLVITIAKEHGYSFLDRRVKYSKKEMDLIMSPKRTGKWDELAKKLNCKKSKLMEAYRVENGRRKSKVEVCRT